MKFTKDTIRKTARTFIQTAIGYLLVNAATYLSGVDYSDGNAVKTVVIGLAVSAVSAGAAAVMNLEKTESEK